MKSVALALAVVVAVASASSMRGAVNVTMPESFGLFNLGSCSGAPACGHVMTTYEGVPAYSNGADQCTGNSCDGSWATGLRYQCVELAQRYFHEKHNIAPIWPISYARQMCDSRPSGVKQTTSPGAGDLIVFNWQPYGHVAVITGVDGSTIHVVEQNSAPSGVNTYSRSEALCFLTV